jgi:hypothetical protein
VRCWNDRKTVIHLEFGRASKRRNNRHVMKILSRAIFLRGETLSPPLQGFFSIVISWFFKRDSPRRTVRQISEN